MLHTLFLLNNQGEILMEKHWRAPVPRSVGDEFWSIVCKAGSPESVLPVISTSKYYLVHIYRGGLFFLAVLHGEAPPTMTIQLLVVIADLFTDYFGGLSEDLVKDNFVTCYQLLDEMVDNGFPVTTEPTVLKDLVPPPSLLSRLANRIDATRSNTVNTTAKSLENSPVPWRKTGVKYANNEIFFDIMEFLDSIVDVNGNVISSEVHGKIECNSRLTGLPDLLVGFQNAQVLEDVCFHPCVRYARYEQDRSLSFVPPDGTFELMRYQVQYNAQAPFYVTPKLTLHGDNGRVNIIVGLKGGGAFAPEKGVQDMMCTIFLPENTESVKLEPTQGSYFFDSVNKILKWDVGRVTKQKSPTIQGSVIPAPGTKFPVGNTPSVFVDFKLSTTLSGLRVESMTLVNEKYKPYKGMKASTRGGRYEIRTA